MLKHEDSIPTHTGSGKRTTEIQISILIGSFSKCWLMHNTREFLIVFISEALFAKCWVFAVQMTFASRYFIRNTLCVNCKAPQTIQRSMIVFLQFCCSTYVPKQGQMWQFLQRLNIMLLQRGEFCVEHGIGQPKISKYSYSEGEKSEFNLILPLLNSNRKVLGKKKKEWKYFCCFFYENIAGYDSV